MKKTSRSGKVRIVGGRWRRHRLRVIDVPGLRPSTDRARETLFNWLAPQLAGARCLDLFAGSGALGLEALSRGAASATLVEKNSSAVALLREQVAHLGANASIEHADALVFLRCNTATRFDIVFLDPPYGSALIGNCIDLLERGGWLSSSAYIYLETGLNEELPQLPLEWRECRSGRCGGSAVRLLRKDY
ncbi:16S rRNA (guanine(966)-N(2))-methyltransferase RsmD [Halorhodospira halochloris]|uniref:16S rRNA (guanine(966)-N(2))-methyltransferase RsmD n=1 Tax=Halorhodospira halochloris TaxID=1052 RepID=UPI001EE989DE|nr:16S rRNA (guanine(966)-N(2))-methyltransferase RsmD [Halorhodospira halochloris]MCG5529793.1 16S rRNA (guanine(966)-N(2))-methyltransferase RsmD [Halorhodospira halochloris]